MDHEGAPEERPAGLAEAVRRLEARVSALEARLAPVQGAPEAARGWPAGDAGAAAPSEEPARPAPSGLGAGLWTGLSLTGRMLLALGGAFLLRAGTDTGTLPPGTGVLMGLAYALVWVALGDRDAARGRRASADFHGLTAILVGYPLIWEATTRFGYLPPSAAVLALTVLTAAALFVGWRRESALLAGTFAVAAAACALGLSFATPSASLIAGWLTGLGVGTLWIAYSRGWLALPWLVAVPANVAVLRVVLAGSAPGGHGSELVGVDPPAAKAVAAALLFGYLGSFALRTLWKRRDVGPFEILQSILALLLGLGGATRIAHAAGEPTGLLGAAALAAALGAYLVAFLFVRRRLGRGRVFFFYGSLALVLALAGCTLAGGSGMRTVTWSALGVLAAVLGGRFDRVSLRAHAALYVAAAAKSSGLFLAVTGALVGGEETWRTHPLAAVGLAGAACAYATLVATRSYRNAPRLARLPRLVLAAVATGGLVAVLVILATRALPPGAFAPTRTFVLAGTAVALAWTARRARLPELGWITWLVLAAGGAKLLLQDLGGGSGSVALFLAFGFYGAALLATPRLLRPAPGPAATPPA